MLYISDKYKFIFEMGARSSTAQGNEYALLLEDYQIVRTIDGDGLFFLKSKKNQGDYLLRQFTFNDKKQYERYVELLEKRKSQLNGCKYVIPLEKIVTKTEDQYCSTFYKIYALFQFTERTLENEINERNIQKRKFQEKQLWSILASCIVGLSHLQKQGIKHQALKSSHVLINQDGVIRIFDPIATGCQSNYDTLIAKRSTPHIYLSPQLADSLQMEMGQPHSHPFKSDIWTMGMIILEGGLTQYQDQCYRDQGSRVHWETIQYNIHRFRQIYSEELTAMLEFMLSREEKNRPDWLELEERVIKQQQLRMSQPNVSKDSFAYRKPERSSQAQVNFNQSFDKRLSSREPQGKLLTSNAVNIYSDPNYKNSSRPYQGQSSVGSVRMPFTESTTKTSFRQSNSRPPFNQGNPRKFTETHQKSSSSIPVQFKPSNIEKSRPLRNIFPNSIYTTTTKVDENLIVVNEEDRFSEIDTPNNKSNGSYFENNSRPRASQNQNSQQQSFYHAYTPTQAQVINNRPPTQVTTYGVSNFESREQHNSQSYQGQRIISGGPNVNSPTIISEPAMIGFAPKIQGHSAPEGGQYVVERYKQGSEYKGYKWQDMRHGFGVFYYQDGGMYEGQWRFNRMQGKGKLYYQSGKLAYEGDWVNDQFQGFGKLYNEYPELSNQPLNYRNLDDVEEMWTKYEGQFNGDLKSGRGVLFLTNGQYYEGEFREDYAEGDGVYHCMNGQKIKGRWNKNTLVE